MIILKTRFLFALVLVTALCSDSLPAAENSKKESQEMKNARMQWFRDAKFGMFIHWGLYSVPAGEWKGKKHYGEWIQLAAKIPNSEYEPLAKQFNPVDFDAREWVRIAKNAGMKYMVFTAKHHEGFCMYDSKLTEYDIVDATPFGRDPIKELSEACREAGIKFCVYYSMVDWHHPEFPARYARRGFHGDPNPEADIAKYAAYQQGQIKELLTQYGPVGILWFDHGGSFQGVNRVELLEAEKLVDMIREIQPQIIINNRLGFGADYGTPEQHIPGSKKKKEIFEVCMTINRKWGYNKNDKLWKPSKVLIRNLIDIASKGGNYLLNVGPTGEGIIPPESAQRLKDIGDWMKVNAEAIYGSNASPFKKPAWGRYTRKNGKLYAHVFQWPKDGKLTITAKGIQVSRAYLLADKEQNLQIEHTPNGLLIYVPEKAPDTIASVVAIEYETKD